MPTDGGPEGERKQVTVLFADVARSMDLAERFDADEWTSIITGLFRVAADAVTRFGGTVDKFTGDGLMAVFGAPVAQEDHAARGCHAALALITAATEYAAVVQAEHRVELAVRVGLNSGEVVAGDVASSGFTAVGHAVGLAQRMESGANPGSVRLTERTARLVGDAFRLRDLGVVQIAGAAEPMHAYELDAATGRTRSRAGTARLVGRQAEWDAIEAALAAADRGQAQVIGIVGEAGAGKSRLCEELAARATQLGMGVRRTAGVSHATSAPLLPIRALLADYFAISDSDSAADVRTKVAARALDLDPFLADDLPLIFDFLEVPDPDRPAPNLGPDARRRRVLEVIRRMTRRRSERAAFVFLFEDLHWFDEHSLAFLDEWLPSFPGTRTLIVTNFRPEFRPPWASRSYYRQLPLSGLGLDDVRALLADLLGTHRSLTALAEDVAERSGGNPFFVEEIVRSWIEDGTLAGMPGGYCLARPAEAVRVPASVHSVLAGRIDRLSATEKALVQTAAVIGRSFPADLLAAVAGAPRVDDALYALCSAELLQQTEDGDYRFWHPLTQEVAYASLLSATRRRHHRATAHALLDTDATRHDELAAVVAGHFEAAADRVEAARWQIRAATTAARTDLNEAIRRLQAGVGHLADAPQTPEVSALGVRGRVQLLRIGARLGLDPADADRIYAEAHAAVQQLDAPVLAAALSMANGVYRMFAVSTGEGRHAMVEAARQADLSDDVEVRAWAYTSGSAPFAYTGPLQAGLQRLDHGVTLCAGDPRVGMGYGYSVLDTGLFLRASFCIPAGMLDAARSGLQAALGAFRIRPMADWQVWTLALFAPLAEATGLASDLDADVGTEEMLRLAEDAGSALGRVRAMQAWGIVSVLRGQYAQACGQLEDGLEILRKHRAAVCEEPGMLAYLAQAQLGCGEVAQARATAQEALVAARTQGAQVVECYVQLVRARIWRQSAAGEADREVAAAALSAAEGLADEVQARTYAAFLAEERIRLDGGNLAEAADGYEAIGAHRHARRVRAASARLD
ncbi:MAG TPA: adenylate/guanylate cyclase domain-containing protein [Sporichthyaceae bacterium]